MSTSDCTVYELRQYTLHAGTTDRFIETFDREFVETQEATGIRVVGQFRDLDRADMFVWIRGFPDMATRRDSLAAFYTSPAWRANAQEANSMMIDSDDVLLLTVASAAGNWAAGPRRAISSSELPAALVEVTVYPLTDVGWAGFDEFYAQQLQPLLTSAGGAPIAALRTESAANTFPSLPVREADRVFVTLSRFADRASYDTHVRALTAEPSWHRVRARTRALTSDRPQKLRLAPTPRSALR